MNFYVNLRVKFNVVLYLLITTDLCSSRSINDSSDVNDESDYVLRVINGKPAALGDVPYQIGFKKLTSRIKKLYGTFCGGVIISESKLVSAAHCFAIKKSGCCSESIFVTGKQLGGTYAVAGNLLNQDVYRADGAGGGQWRLVKVVVYPSTYKFPKHDICVAVTTKPFVFNSHVAAIPYATRFKEYEGPCLVSGYGRTTGTHTFIKGSSPILLLADLPIIRTAACSRKHHQNMRNFVCTSDQVSDVSKGDSGGPLVCPETGGLNEGSNVSSILVGIVSGNRRGSGSFFSRVSSYYKYIQRNNVDRVFVLSHYLIIMCVMNEFYLF